MVPDHILRILMENNMIQQCHPQHTTWPSNEISAHGNSIRQLHLKVSCQTETSNNRQNQQMSRKPSSFTKMPCQKGKPAA
nr:hypothetical protein [Tanacetum cinerariifolium]